MSLQMIRRLWITSDGGNASSSSSMHLTKLTEARFTKDGYSQIRCFLAMQVMSQTVVWLIDNYADKCGCKDEYAPLRAVVKKLDMLVDIMNSRVQKGFAHINSPVHKYLDELTSVLQIFSEWYLDVKEK
eukprot:6515213-Ditylum_brightwellii.AAC.1